MVKKGILPPKVRNVAVVGHRSSGKTSLGDLLLCEGGATRTVGQVDQGTSLLDYSAEARRGRQTLEPSTAWLNWREHLLYLVDSPGAQDLVHVAEHTLHQADAALLCVAANDGLAHGCVRMLQAADAIALPALAVIHQADRPHSLPSLIEGLRAHTDRRVLPFQLPFVDDEGTFAGVIDLLANRVLRYDSEAHGQYSVEPVPDRYTSAVEAAREALVETVALDDEELLERYLEFLELPTELVVQGLARAVRQGRLLPVVFTSTAAVIGAGPLLDAVVDLLPPPQPSHRVDVPSDDMFAATVLHTTVDDEGRPCTLFRVWSGQADKVKRWSHGESGQQLKVRKLFAIRGPRRALPAYTGPGAVLATWDAVDARPGETLTAAERYALRRPALPPVMVRRELRLADGQDPRALERAAQVLVRMDHGLELERDADGTFTLLARTLGQVDRAVGWLKHRMGVAITAERPSIDYREVPANGTWGVEGVHLREVGGLVEEYGRCALDLDPEGRPGDLAFLARVDHEDLPERFVGAVRQGALEAARTGPLGFPVIGARVTCVGGEYDILSSTEDHFRIAGAAAMRAALTATGTRLAEPWTRVEVHAPAEGVGAVLDALTSRRGRILDVCVDHEARVEALCPERETHDLVGRLGALTGGRGWFSSRRSHYDLLPDGLVAEAIRELGLAAPASVESEPVSARREVVS